MCLPCKLLILKAISIALAFCMGTEIEYTLNNPIGRLVAQIFFQQPRNEGHAGTVDVCSDRAVHDRF